MAKKNGSTPQGKRTAPLELIELDFREHETAQLLMDLAIMASKGEINGLVFAVRMTDQGGDPYMFGSGGRLMTNKAEGIGAAVLLQNSLAQA